VTEEELEAGQSAFNAALEQTKRQMQQERDAEHSTKNFKKKFANP